MARAYLTDDERKEGQIVFRVTVAQLAKLDAEAEALGITRSMLLRRRLLPKAPKTVPVLASMEAGDGASG